MVLTGYRLRLSPEEAGCLNSLIGPWFSHQWASESFRELVWLRIEKQALGSVGPEVVKGLMLKEARKAASSVGERADGRPRDTGALRAV